MIALYEDKFSTTENHTFRVIGATWTCCITSLREVIVAPLNLDNKCHGFPRVDGE